MSTLLIFGVGGFVGPYLAKEFKENGYSVYGSDVLESCNNEYLEGYFKCDILNKDSMKELLEKVKPTHIINLAAISSVGQSWKIPEITMNVNVNGTLNIFNSCLAVGIKPKILLIGSSEEYIPSDSPINEDTPINANNPYGISKIAQEQFAAIYRDTYNWPIYCVRAFNHIGVGQRDTFVIPSWCKQVAMIEKGEKEPKLIVGNLEVARDFTDVRDIVKAYKLVIESNYCHEVFNLGSGNAYKLKDILKTLLAFSTKEIEVEIDSALLRKNDNKVICCDSSKANKLLGWKAAIPFEETIKSLFDNYLKQ